MATQSTPILKSYISDNTAGVSPELLIAMARANAGHSTPYGQDDATAALSAAFSGLFGCAVGVFPVASGTAANGLSLSVLTPPWGAILCHPDAHINGDEAGAPEFYTNGAKMVLVDGPDSKIDPDALKKAVRKGVGSVHNVQPAVVSITQSTESGGVYTRDEITTICAIAHEAGLKVHMDGARFANAVVALEANPADLTVRAGVDILSFGATKNGAATVDAVISFDPNLNQDLRFRHKRAGQLCSKMRFQSAQLLAYLEDDLWLKNAAMANVMAARLRAGLEGIPALAIEGNPVGNIIYCQVPEHVIAALHEDGFRFYESDRAPGLIRLVTSFTHQPADIDALVAAMAKAVAAHASH